MKVQRYRYGFRSRSGHCHFEGYYPHLTGSTPREAAVNRLLTHIWCPDERSACKGTSVAAYRQQTDFRVTAHNDTCVSFRFHVRGQFDGSDVVEQRVEGFTVDLEHASEVTPFKRAQYDALMARAPKAPPAPKGPGAGERARPCGFYVRPTGIMLLFGDTREVHVPWRDIVDIIDRVPALRGFLPKPDTGGEGAAGDDGQTPPA